MEIATISSDLAWLLGLEGTIIEVGAGGFLFLVVPAYVEKRHTHGQICLDIRMISKESISVDESGLAQFLRFRRFGPMSSDLSYAVESRRFDVQSQRLVRPTHIMR